MGSRRVNPDRTRRYIACTTPDEIQAQFDPIEDGVQLKYEKTLREFIRRMKIKHGKNVSVDVYMEDTIKPSFRFSKLVTIRVRGVKEK